MSHMPSMQYERGSALLPGMLGILEQQQQQRNIRTSPLPHHHSPVHRDSFAAFYEPADEEFHVRETSAAASGSLEDIFEIETRVQRGVRPTLSSFRQDTIRSQEMRYEAHRKASKVQEANPTQLIEEPQKVPRDAQTEKRCQMFSVFVTLLSLLAIFFFAMTKPVWTTTIPPDYYKSLCSIEDVIPIHGTAECNSVRSRDHTKVHCVISCTNGVNEDAVDENFVMNADGTSFNLTCDKGRNAWTYEVNSICT